VCLPGRRCNVGLISKPSTDDLGRYTPSRRSTGFDHCSDQAIAKLKAAGIPAAALAKKHTDKEVGVGTMHRMKGMEFRCVAVIGVGEHGVPPASAITPAEEDILAHEQDLQRERCLLFVACTRAREELGRVSGCDQFVGFACPSWPDPVDRRV